MSWWWWWGCLTGLVLCSWWSKARMMGLMMWLNGEFHLQQSVCKLLLLLLSCLQTRGHFCAPFLSMSTTLEEPYTKSWAKNLSKLARPQKKRFVCFFLFPFLFVICSPVCCLFPNPINPFRCMRRSGYIWKEISLSACLVLSEIPRHGREARAMAVVIFFFSGCTIAKGRSSSSE